MTAALGTLVFLTTVWMIVVVAAEVMERSGSKILAALKGEVPAPSVQMTAIRVRYRQRAVQSVRATPRLRAVA